MNRKTRSIILFAFSIILALGVYAFIMYGLADFNDPNNGTNGLRVDESNDIANRAIGYGLVDLNSSDFSSIGLAVGHFIWETRAIDVILIGIMLFVASESAGAVVQGMETQRSEFRTEMCETDKFIILEEMKDGEKQEETD